MRIKQLFIEIKFRFYGHWSVYRTKSHRISFWVQFQIHTENPRHESWQRKVICWTHFYPYAVDYRERIVPIFLAPFPMVSRVIQNNFVQYFHRVS